MQPALMLHDGQDVFKEAIASLTRHEGGDLFQVLGGGFFAVTADDLIAGDLSIELAGLAVAMTGAPEQRTIGLVDLAAHSVALAKVVAVQGADFFKGDVIEVILIL
jgi:hypothetical protein